MEAPLFCVRTGKSGSHQEKTIYCYSEAEQDATSIKLGGKPEITQFIGKEMRLSKVEYATRAEPTPILNFYVVKNTPEHTDYIMEWLVVTVVE